MFGLGGCYDGSSYGKYVFAFVESTNSIYAYQKFGICEVAIFTARSELSEEFLSVDGLKNVNDLAISAELEVWQETPILSQIDKMSILYRIEMNVTESCPLPSRILGDGSGWERYFDSAGSYFTRIGGSIIIVFDPVKNLIIVGNG